MGYLSSVALNFEDPLVLTFPLATLCSLVCPAERGYIALDTTRKSEEGVYNTLCILQLGKPAGFDSSSLSPLLITGWISIAYARLSCPSPFHSPFFYIPFLLIIWLVLPLPVVLCLRSFHRTTLDCSCPWAYLLLWPDGAQLSSDHKGSTPCGLFSILNIIH